MDAEQIEVVQGRHGIAEMATQPMSRIQKIHKILSSATYRGEHYYNVIDSRTGKKRPPAEWITVAVDPIIDAETFERVRQRRRAAGPPPFRHAECPHPSC